MRINSCPVKCSRKVDESGHFVDGRPPGSNPDPDMRIGNEKSACGTRSSMPVCSRRVRIQDMDGVSHTVEVTAATLYEAVAQGLAAIRRNEWVAGVAQVLNVVKVSVADIRVEHEVN